VARGAAVFSKCAALRSPTPGEARSPAPLARWPGQAADRRVMAVHEIKRETLPIADVEPAGVVTYDAKDPDTAFPAIEPLRPPAGAPNVLIVLFDDVGFGASSAFGARTSPSSPSTRPPTSAATAARRSRRTTRPSTTGSRAPSSGSGSTSATTATTT
jgi:hypothetical protein